MLSDDSSSSDDMMGTVNIGGRWDDEVVAGAELGAAGVELGATGDSFFFDQIFPNKVVGDNGVLTGGLAFPDFSSSISCCNAALSVAHS